jgi:small subunit ribosomal protein S4
MTKIVKAKYKIDRRLGVNLWGRGKSPLHKNPHRPGQHGQANHKPSDYGIQQRSKQKLKAYYNLGERSFRRLYQEAIRRRGDTGENLIGLLEQQLVAVVYRMKFAPTIFAARQFVSHGHVKVNGKRVNIASYQVRPGDQIELSDKMRDNVVFLQGVESAERDVPDYLESDGKAMKGKFLRVPALADVPYPVRMEPNLVIEFYSR